MKFSVDPTIFEKFPGVSIGVVSIYDIVNDRNVSEIVSLLREEEARQQTMLTGVELGSLPEIAEWRNIFTAFGSSKDFRSSVESLLRRARAGTKPLPDINSLVNLYNYLSLKYHLPAGAEDLDKINGDIRLTFSDGTEKGIALGYDREEAPDPGEVIYRDDTGFICRKWNWREADRTKIEPGTKRAVLVLEKAPAVAANVLEEALHEAAVLGESLLGGKCAIIVLDAAHPSCNL